MKELIFILGMLLLPAMCFADDNIITMEQTGDNFELTIDQIGYNNVIQRWRTNSPPSRSNGQTETKAIVPKAMTGSGLLKRQESTFQPVA